MKNKKGRWVDVHHDEYGYYTTCSECGAKFLTPTDELLAFCPDCRVEMEE